MMKKLFFNGKALGNVVERKEDIYGEKYNSFVMEGGFELWFPEPDFWIEETEYCYEAHLI